MRERGTPWERDRGELHEREGRGNSMREMGAPYEREGNSMRERGEERGGNSMTARGGLHGRGRGELRDKEGTP